jgi:hypothetical protein
MRPPIPRRQTTSIPETDTVFAGVTADCRSSAVTIDADTFNPITPDLRGQRRSSHVRQPGCVLEVISLCSEFFQQVSLYQVTCASGPCTIARSGYVAAKARMYCRFRGEYPFMSGEVIA